MDHTELRKPIATARSCTSGSLPFRDSNADQPQVREPACEGTDRDPCLGSRCLTRPIPVFHPHGFGGGRLGSPDKIFRRGEMCVEGGDILAQTPLDLLPERDLAVPQSPCRGHPSSCRTRVFAQHLTVQVLHSSLQGLGRDLCGAFSHQSGGRRIHRYVHSIVLAMRTIPQDGITYFFALVGIHRFTSAPIWTWGRLPGPISRVLSRPGDSWQPVIPRARCARYKFHHQHPM